MRQAQAEIDEAVGAWLDSHKAYTRYLNDTEALFEIFAMGWRGSPRGLSDAFANYREALLTENGYQSEVRDFQLRCQPTAD